MDIRNSFGIGRGTAVCVGTLMAAGSAMAVPPLDFDFQHLDSAFQSSTSTLTISAEDQPGFFSFGTVRRNLGSTGTSLFDQGFVSEPNPADFRMSLFITQITPSTALATGPMTITDVDGDVFTATINGTFVHSEGGSSLLATMTNMAFVSDEGLFDGPDGGAFPTAFAPGALSLGTLRLSFVSGPRSSFDGDFQDAETGLVGWVPAPSGAAVLALGGLAAARRRRN